MSSLSLATARLSSPASGRASARPRGKGTQAKQSGWRPTISSQPSSPGGADFPGKIRGIRHSTLEEQNSCNNTTPPLCSGDGESTHIPPRQAPRRPRPQTATHGGRGASKTTAQFHCRTGANPRKSQGCRRAHRQSQWLEARPLFDGRPRPAAGAQAGPPQAPNSRPRRQQDDAGGPRPGCAYAAVRSAQTHARGLGGGAKVPS